MNHIKFFFISITLLVYSAISAQTPILDSGGPLSPEQAAYDVTFYDLSVSIKPETREIDGQVIVRAKVVHPMNQLVLDLDTLLNVQEIWDLSNPKKPIAAPFVRKVGQIWIDLGFTRQAGEQVQVRILYGGKPRVAARAPWDGGFTWATTKSGAPWITTTCQGEGADLWWPCKDHVSDEPDSMAFNVRVPEPLVAACNGRLRSTIKHKDGTQTFHWYISTPINIYNVALNLAPYRSIEGPYKSVTGETFPVVFYVLPDDYEKGKKLFTEIFEHIKFYEKMLGPYPFRVDKYGVAQTPHLGMEHQSIIAYGANFNNGSMTGGKDWGFDALHHHEFGHEWWGNLVTNYDWKDMWIHEGFCTYMQALYMEELKGIKGYHDYMNASRRFPNNLAVAPLASQSSKQIYRAPIYTKGAWILHALRAVIGKEALLKSMRRLCYDTPEAEKIKDGRQCHFVTTADFQLICEQESGKALGWFFDVYLRQPQLPKLVSKVEGQQISLHWETPQNLPFSFPVEIKINGKIQRLDLGKETITLSFNPGDKPEVDPDRWGLYDIAK
ncbi:M1 family metallopeptidase [Haliscomenobacter sp.]|uniref:M1 family metallopeptidase n=1 Tax=Haliscomenobacter sp. TaxID=2717303 RepID=UPI003BA9949A